MAEVRYTPHCCVFFIWVDNIQNLSRCIFLLTKLSFRDDEVNWDYVRVLPDGECVSVDGTHLGHNLPDGRNRYCINLVSVAGKSTDSS